jgi:hypothetical protein
MQFRHSSVSSARRRLVAALACALALCCVASVTAAAVATGAATAGRLAAGVVKLPASASLEQCVTAVSQLERSATFVGEMTAVAGTARMQMRIEVLERTPHEVVFHPIASPGLGAWQRSSPGVKTYKTVDKVSDLSGPALYRAAIHFRWLNARGRVIKALELHTSRCDEPAPSTAAGEPPTGSAGA